MTQWRMGLRFILSAGTLSLLAACASQPQIQLTATQEAAVYKSHAKANYAPPGPPSDPWGPYIMEASARFDVPDRWIREVMRVESNGYQYRASGVLTTSPVGAMGLMQLMPETYDELRGRYGLGEDAYDPHANILAGTAYLREMYDAFGSPGFLAAYNGGPARLEDYLTRNRPLPTETRRYVAMIGPYIRDSFPEHRSPAEQLAMNRLPIDIPPGPRWVRHANVALASRQRRGHELVRYAALERRRGHVHVPGLPSGPVEVAEAPPAGARHHGFHFVSQAYAAETVPHGGGHGWAVQMDGAGAHRPGAVHGRVQLASHVAPAHERLTGLTHGAAMAACHKAHGHCLVISPAARS